jgi:ABC-type iron transport system FetAB ATPase subunit
MRQRHEKEHNRVSKKSDKEALKFFDRQQASAIRPLQPTDAVLRAERAALDEKAAAGDEQSKALLEKILMQEEQHKSVGRPQLCEWLLTQLEETHTNRSKSNQSNRRKK